MGDQLKFITFLLAPIGYAGLTAVTVMAAQGQLPALLLRVTVTVIVAHVFMVWHVHYGWQFSEATRNGYVGFVLFHGALAAIVASTMAPPHIARILLAAAFLVVTLGALAATAEYEVVRAYRIPVMLLAAVGLIGVAYRPVSVLIRRFVG